MLVQNIKTPMCKTPKEEETGDQDKRNQETLEYKFLLVPGSGKVIIHLERGLGYCYAWLHRDHREDTTCPASAGKEHKDCIKVSGYSTRRLYRTPYPLKNPNRPLQLRPQPCQHHRELPISSAVQHLRLSFYRTFPLL